MKISFLSAKAFITDHTVICFRVVLFLVFIGHGFVSLGFSPSYELHYRIFESVNIFNWDIAQCLKYLGLFDIAMALLILSGFVPSYVLSITLTYLSTVAIAAYFFFLHKTNSYFGIAETFRRFSWIFYAVFLWIYFNRKRKIYSLLRIGIGFAFLAHGLASMGFFGLNGGHIELAKQVLSEETANKVVYYSGYSDTILGLLMISGIFSRPAAVMGCVWLVFIVYLSALLAFPDAIFRTGFLVSCFYVATDKRCHSFIWEKGSIGTDNK